jgi:hypothetical protein
VENIFVLIMVDVSISHSHHHHHQQQQQQQQQQQHELFSKAFQQHHNPPLPPVFFLSTSDFKRAVFSAVATGQVRAATMQFSDMNCICLVAAAAVSTAM